MNHLQVVADLAVDIYEHAVSALATDLIVKLEAELISASAQSA